MRREQCSLVNVTTVELDKESSVGGFNSVRFFRLTSCDAYKMGYYKDGFALWPGALLSGFDCNSIIEFTEIATKLAPDADAHVALAAPTTSRDAPLDSGS